MNDPDIAPIPHTVHAIRSESDAIGFDMASDPRTGSLLRTLAASKPGGRFLELGTGTGLGTAWLLAGMDARSRLDSVESDARPLEVARRHLGADRRVTFHHDDGAALLARLPAAEYDFIFADAWPGKFTHLELALSLLKIGGIYLVDDLLPQPNWPEDHAPKVPPLVARLERQPHFTATPLAWSSGLMILVRQRAD